MDFNIQIVKVLKQDDGEVILRVGGFNGVLDMVAQTINTLFFVFVIIMFSIAGGALESLVAILVGFIVYSIASIKHNRYTVIYEKRTGIVTSIRKSCFGIFTISKTTSKSPVRAWRVDKSRDWTGREGFEPCVFLAITEAREIVRCSSEHTFLKSSMKDTIALLTKEVDKTEGGRSVLEVSS